MEKADISKVIKELREKSKKRKFNQSFDLIVNLDKIDPRKDTVDEFVVLHFNKGKKSKICALVDKDLIKQSKEVFDKTISKEEFAKLTKKDIRKLAKEFDFFVAQVTIMVEVAKYFGKILGPREKMPNPKAGSVIAPTSNLKILYDKLQKTVRLKTRKEPVIKTIIGKEDMKDEEIQDNILIVYNSLLHSLPREKHNIKNVLLKLTMSKPVKIK